MQSPLFSILSPYYKCIFFYFLFQHQSIHLHLHRHRHRPPPLSPAGNNMAHSKITVVLNRIFIALLTCAFSLGGAAIGVITGALKGQTTETGFLRGAGVGAVTGAITALQLMEMMANGESFSKVALLHSLLNGKVFVEWVSPAMLKAYQWQANAMEMTFTDMFETENNGITGLSEDIIDSLPKCIFGNSSGSIHNDDKYKETNCTICLQDFKNGEEGRELLNCRHVFHLKCIDEWLIRQGSCPICRKDV